MIGRIAATAFSAALLLALALPAHPETGTTPSWMTIDKSARRVRLDIVSGFDANNGALNFNGYFTGNMTVVVPAGWTVQIDFKNQDAMLPHSLLVTKPYAKDRFPDVAGVNEVAIPRAYTNSPEEGIPSPKTDKVTFTAKDPGEFYFLCGAPGHAQGGMWTRFKVDAAAEQPYVTVAPGADPGRS